MCRRESTHRICGSIQYLLSITAAVNGIALAFADYVDTARVSEYWLDPSGNTINAIGQDSGQQLARRKNTHSSNNVHIG